MITAPSGPRVTEVSDTAYEEAEAKALTLAVCTTGRPLARLSLLGDEVVRRQDAALRIAFAFYVRGQQELHNLPVTAACVGCGQPTGSFCDECAAPLCGRCEESDQCRVCLGGAGVWSGP